MLLQNNVSFPQVTISGYELIIKFIKLRSGTICSAGFKHTFMLKLCR